RPRAGRGRRPRRAQERPAYGRPRPPGRPPSRGRLRGSRPRPALSPSRPFPGPAPRRVPFFGPRRPLGFPVTPFPGGTPMATATPNMLNATLPLKQDPASQAKIKEFAARFKDDISPKVWEVLKKSRMVHYARFTVIQEAGVAKYVQILTEYDTDFITYSQFF